MLVTTKNGPLIDKLMILASGDLDLLLLTMRQVARNGVADLADIVAGLVAASRLTGGE